MKQVLDGTISEKGVLAPMNPSLNKPLMQELKKYGLVPPLGLFRLIADGEFRIECKEKIIT